MPYGPLNNLDDLGPQGRRTYFRVCRSTRAAANLFECWQVLSRKLGQNRKIITTSHFLPPRIGGHRLPRYRNSFLRSGLMCADPDVTGEERTDPRDRGKPLAGKSTLNRLELTPAAMSFGPRPGVR